MNAPVAGLERPGMPDPVPRDLLPLSLLNDYLYCPRRAALKVVEGWREANVHTDRGDIVHEHSDLAGYEVAKGTLLWRALPVWSERLGLNGRCDIVEVRDAGGQMPDAGGQMPDAGGQMPDGGVSGGARLRRAIPTPDAGGQLPDGGVSGGARLRRAVPMPNAGGQMPDSGYRMPEGRGRRVGGRSLFPVEFKLGKRRRWENDDAQLCAQALCLEEMFGVPVPRGAVFHADSKRRREVEFTAELRAQTEQAVAGLHALLEGRLGPSAGPNDPEPGGARLRRALSSTLNPQPSPLPLAACKPACQECSLYDICLPRATAGDGRPERLARQLFEV